MLALGIDIGGTGIKGAVVDTVTGEFTVERLRIPTPTPATPSAVAAVVAQITQHFDWSGPVGCTFPGVIKGGTVHTAAHVDRSWIDLPAADVFSQATGCPVVMVNDADAAGYAESRFGVEQARTGLVIMLTLGTGIGSAVLLDGLLVPNTELGHLPLGKHTAEESAAESVREQEDLGWKGWSKRLSDYMTLLELLMWPDLYVIGGGVSKKGDKFIPRLTCRTPVVAAKLLNTAGIVGAALVALDAGSTAEITPPSAAAVEAEPTPQG